MSEREIGTTEDKCQTYCKSISFIAESYLSICFKLPIRAKKKTEKKLGNS